MIDVFTEFDKWVGSRGNGQYATEEDVLTPIQQVREEIVELVNIISNLSGNALEIGLGVYGGSHMLWRLLFDRVTTIDNDSGVVEAFKQREVLDGRSILIVSDSQQVQISGEYCFLHIDGDHTFDGVKLDYLKYSKLVNGIIAIHDLLLPSVNKFVNELEDGNIDGRKHSINRIVRSKRVGYAWEAVNG